jgi:L-ascorbate metabolism protein UlaG (beta-lactamase superfamily)
MRIRYLSHSCFEIRNKKTLLIDPFFTGNPLAPRYTGRPDLVLATHEHSDHADSAFLAEAGVPIVCTASCKVGKAHVMRVGEKETIEGIGVEMIGASHQRPPASPSPLAAGYIIEIDGKRIAHLGDTYIEGVKPLRDIDVLLIPIGGYYTMNVDEAVQALKIIKPKLAIPMHYDTFPQIKADPNEFRRKAEREGFKVRVMKIGEEIEV